MSESGGERRKIRPFDRQRCVSLTDFKKTEKRFAKRFGLEEDMPDHTLK